MDALLKTMNVNTLALPQHILDIIPPQPPGFAGSREHFRGYADPVLDPLSMAETASDLSAGLIFNASRAARLVIQHARNNNQLSLHDVITTVVASTIKKTSVSGYSGAVQRAVNTSVLRNLLQLAANSNAAPDVQAISRFHANELKSWLDQQTDREKDQTWKGHYTFLSGWVSTFNDDPNSFKPSPAPYTPPGAPIGSFDSDHHLHYYCEF